MGNFKNKQKYVPNNQGWFDMPVHGLIHDGQLRACPSCLLGWMYVHKWLYAIKCLGFQLVGGYIKGQALPFSF